MPVLEIHLSGHDAYLMATAQYNDAKTLLEEGDKAGAGTVILKNLDRWMEIGFLLEPAKLAEHADRPDIAGELFEKHGDTEKHAMEGTRGKWHAYENALRNYRDAGDRASVGRVLDKLTLGTRPVSGSSPAPQRALRS